MKICKNKEHTVSGNDTSFIGTCNATEKHKLYS